MSEGLNTKTEAGLALLVTFLYGAGFATAARYTTWSGGIVDGSETFAPEPSMEVVMNSQHGGSADTPVQLRMVIRTPLDTLTSQRSHCPVRVKIEEVDPADLSTRRILFGGVIKMSDRNLDGKTGVVRIEIAGWRYSLELASNAWQANTTCNNTFGDVICGFDLSAVRETAVVSALDGNLVTLTGLTTTAVDGYWRFGYLALGGLQIKIREYTTGSQVTLLSTPPASWLGGTVTLTPGCDKRLATCRDRWEREERFTGFGIVIPAYNPLLEST